MISKFGQYIRKIRSTDSLSQMANKLGITIVELSAMEVGRQEITSDVINKIISAYNLSTSEENELTKASSETNKYVKEEVMKMNLNSSDSSLKFSRKINTDSNELIDRLRKALQDD